MNLSEDSDEFDDQIGFLAKIAYAHLEEFEFPLPVWDYIGRAKSTTQKPIPNPAGYLTTSLRADLGPQRWAEFQTSFPDALHCHWLMLQIDGGQIMEGT
jgi:hypothetical protein